MYEVSTCLHSKKSFYAQRHVECHISQGMCHYKSYSVTPLVTPTQATFQVTNYLLYCMYTECLMKANPNPALHPPTLHISPVSQRGSLEWYKTHLNWWANKAIQVLKGIPPYMYGDEVSTYLHSKKSFYAQRYYGMSYKPRYVSL